MAEISVGSQIFDLVFHPSHATLYTASLSGEVKGVSYTREGKNQQQFSIKVSKKSCRGITLNEDGTRLYVAGKGKAIYAIDTETSKVTESRVKAHETPINRVKHVQPWLFSTGDDDGVIKLWDPRKKESIRTYKHHFDYITDFLWLQDSKHLVATSGDGTLSVLDVRSKSSEPFAQSEDQEDELLSIVPIKGGTKVIVGTQLGILSVFNRSSGWGDCVDRIPGHPHSVDALCSLPSALPNVDSSSMILTGSSDGFLRAVNIFPTKLHGVVADHGEWPVERIAVGGGMAELTLHDNDGSPESKDEGKVGSREEEGEDQEQDASAAGIWWAASAGHDEVLKLTDLGSYFSKGSREADDEEEERDDSDNDADDPGEGTSAVVAPEGGGSDEGADNDSDSDAPNALERDRKKRKRKDKDPMLARKRKAKNEVEIEGAFFDDL
ncbi:hypothetical protein V5O48_003180 [Marasmius crinis-equi]|uniref:WD repeat-containing protein JIP5 n=1 Tax=Marasmius crinis-equi TaxID=585013 RepID=A0ABR3FTK6_9AGAR